MLKILALCLALGCLLSPVAAQDPLKFYEYTGKRECQDSIFGSLATPAGYPFLSYRTTTEDGYVLRMFRLQKKNSQIVGGKPVVLLQHGLFDSADNWIINEEKGSLGFLLADAGYDVWLTNSRGNKYSRLNKYYTPNQSEFWNYSFQEMGKYDVKANIDFILKTTGQAKLTYVGHSQGTSQMFAALGRKDTADFVNARVKKFIALAPIVYLANSRSKLLNGASHFKIFVDACKLFKIDEWLPSPCSQTSVQTQFQSYVCKQAPIFCEAILSIADYNPKYDNMKRMNIFAQHAPSGTSLRTLLHYQQSIVQKNKYSPAFLMYDFGARENQKVYGTTNVPEFDLGYINIPVRGFVGMNDNLGDPVDNSFLKSRLQSLGKNYKDYIYSDCGHMTFMWPLNPTAIFKDILYEIGTA